MEIAKLAGQEGDGGDYEIWPENADALRAFSFCESQWRVAFGPMGGAVWMGLRWDAVDRALRIFGIPDNEETWWAIRVLEREASAALNEKAGEK
ncbi:MAG: DUF1799 domain-containing protein [Betaproteobacteria bacterium]|nr:DUF1799 domain-containing protein [Betaproteobacteria bacterium]